MDFHTPLSLPMMEVSAGTVNTHGNDVTVTDTLDLAGTTFAMGAADPDLTVSASDLLTDGVVTFGGGTLSVAGDLGTSNGNLEATSDATLTLDTTGVATLGNLALAGAPEPTLTVTTGPSKVSFKGPSGHGTLQWAGDAGDLEIRETLSPGASTGWVDVVNSLTLGAGSTYACDVADPAALLPSDIVSASQINIESGASLAFQVREMFKAGTYTILEGPITGTFVSPATGLGDYVSAGAGDGLAYSATELTVTVDKDLLAGDANLDTTVDEDDALALITHWYTGANPGSVWG
ncbi:MAG: hypothetical protein GY901_14460, partial [Actinomycetia bacterium]|nr:hypothetical protein [Actinomycetes bacterium]